MVKINSDNLEKALSKNQSPQNISKEEEIGYHKGALNTLINERNELFRMIQVVESIAQAHLQKLQELGVKMNLGGQDQNSVKKK